MDSSSAELQLFCFKDAMRKVNEKLAACRPLPPVLLLATLEVELPLVVSVQETQTFKETIEIGYSSEELKTSAFESDMAPSVIKETLDEFKRESAIVRQYLDKHDEIFEEQAEINHVITNMLKDIMSRLHPLPHPQQP